MHEFIDPRLTANTHLGTPSPLPNRKAIEIFAQAANCHRNLIGLNFNGLETTTRPRQAEHLAVRKAASLFSLPKHQGYTTSGGTEANIHALWKIRDRLGLKRIHYGDTAHYSIEKARLILGLSRAKDHKGSCIRVITLGEPASGNVDNIEVALEWLERNPDAFLHMDAAYGGFLLLDYLRDRQYQLQTLAKRISLTIDFAKTGRGPYGCAMALLPPDLASGSLIHADYIPGRRDETLTGSRSFAGAYTALWLLNHYGPDGYRRISQEVENRCLFLEKLLKKKKITYKRSLNVIRLFIPYRGWTAPDSFDKVWGLSPFQENKRTVIRILVFQQTNEALSQFVDELEAVC